MMKHLEDALIKLYMQHIAEQQRLQLSSLRILIFHNWKRKVQFSNKMEQHSLFSNSVQCVLNGVTALWQLCYVTGYMKRDIVGLKYRSMRL